MHQEANAQHESTCIAQKQGLTPGICRRGAENIDCFIISEVKLNMSLNINSWKEIPWSTVEQTVFRLQLRIYKASAKDELEKMYKLQKLLISSRYARYWAVRKVTQENTGKKTPGVDKVLITSPAKRFDLANHLILDGKSKPILRQYIPKPNGRELPLGIPTIEDRCKQMLAYLALSPQWEAKFDEYSYGFRPGRSVPDAMEAVFLGISRRPKWVLDADIKECFPSIAHDLLLDKCETYPEMRQQLRAWLKAGIMEDGSYTIPEMGTTQGGLISPLLANIALDGLREKLDAYIHTLPGSKKANRSSLTYVRYADDFILMYPNQEVLEHIRTLIQEFLEPLGLTLHPTKTRMVHTLETAPDGTPPGFTFLGFDVHQRQKRVRQRAVFTKRPSKRPYVTLITPSREGVRVYRKKIRETIRQYRGVKQEKLIYRLNPMIRGWALSKRSQVSSEIFQDLDAYIYKHLWKWARRRHHKMARYKLKALYWHKVGKDNWAFGVKDAKGEISLQLQKHSKIQIQRHAKVKGKASPFNGDHIYWAKRTGKSPLIPPIKARLIREQDGRCGICGQHFCPDDTIERHHILPKALGGKNIRENVHAVHRHCHLKKTSGEMLEIRRNRR
jgi:RNA-directed DNA polymerase